MKLREPKKITEKFGFVGGNFLQSILDKLPEAVTDEEREVLKARRAYLTDDQLERFGVDVEEEPKEEFKEEPQEELETTEEPKEESAKEKKAREKAEKKANKK
jgi:hypothetical protein